MRRGFRRLIQMGIVVLILQAAAFAMRIELSNEIFKPDGRGANRSLFVTNNTSKMLAAEIYVKKRTMDSETGNDILTDEDGFLVYPNQLLLQPGEQQVATVTWVGDKSPDKELAFRIVVEQLNLDMANDKGGQSTGGISVEFTALTKILKSAYVTPNSAKPDVIIESVQPKKGDSASLEIVVSNRGTAHQIFKDEKCKVIPVSGGVAMRDKAVSLSMDNLGGAFNLLAKSKRRFVVAWPKGLPAGYTYVGELGN